MTIKRWNYSGDMNICEGGFYWQESGFDDHVYAVGITPCSDAGGPSNLFWITKGSIYLGDKARQIYALDCIGVDPENATRFDYVEAMRAYAGIEPDSYGGQSVVQIGKLDPDDWNGRYSYRGFALPEPDYILRGNASLRRFIRREFLGLVR